MQWAAVRNTSGAINEPEQNGTASPPKLTSIAPTLGCPFPSGSPKVMAAACGVTTRPTTAVIAATINILRMPLPPARRSATVALSRNVKQTTYQRHPEMAARPETCYDQRSGRRESNPHHQLG